MKTVRYAVLRRASEFGFQEMVVQKKHYTGFVHDMSEF